MTSVINGREDDLSRPEDATTLEEFQARRDAELARIRAVRRSWRHRAQYAGVIAGLMSCGALWYWFWQSAGIPRFAILALTLACNYVLVRIANHVTGTKRRRDLDRLTAQWQPRATR